MPDWPNTRRRERKRGRHVVQPDHRRRIGPRRRQDLHLPAAGLGEQPSGRSAVHNRHPGDWHHPERRHDEHSRPQHHPRRRVPLPVVPDQRRHRDRHRRCHRADLHARPGRHRQAPQGSDHVHRRQRAGGGPAPERALRPDHRHPGLHHPEGRRKHGPKGRMVRRQYRLDSRERRRQALRL